ncbi:MAG: oligosaccharide repeat unit polymerase [Candidatus Doudnabacteria bacterium]|nr:oligosaccharide repeat unit polymerase [Candidatus Doudnabacteria bacterium]
MQIFIITILTIASVVSFWQFISGSWLRKYQLSPLWLMLSVWFIAIAISQLRLSELELIWPGKYWYLLFVSLLSFTLGFFVFDKIWQKYPWWRKFGILTREKFSEIKLEYLIYFLFLVSLVALYMFYKRAGNFPLLAEDPDVFRFEADEKVPGLINYLSQLARIFIPLSFFLIFKNHFSWRKYWDLTVIGVIGTVFLILFASRTQIFFIDLWIMAMYLLMRKPNLKQALKFYPIFLLISVFVLAAVPLIRQYKSYGSGYLAGVTGIDQSNYNPLSKAFVPIYIGVSFNQQALLHAEQYYRSHPVQHGKVSLDPFTNIVGLDQYKSNYDLGAIFYSWWNTGTYLFPFVQDFGDSAFYFAPFFIAGILTLVWHYWKSAMNFLSINLYAYAMFFIVMTVYLSFTVRAEMYLDLALLFIAHLFVGYES